MLGRATRDAVGGNDSSDQGGVSAACPGSIHRELAVTKSSAVYIFFFSVDSSFFSSIKFSLVLVYKDAEKIEEFRSNGPGGVGA